MAVAIKALQQKYFDIELLQKVYWPKKSTNGLMAIIDILTIDDLLDFLLMGDLK